MKKLLVVLVFGMVGTVFGQTKVASVNSQKVMDTMPSYRQAVVALEQVRMDGMREIQNLEAELQRLYKEYQEAEKTQPPVILEHKAKTIQQKEQEYQQKQYGLEQGFKELSQNLNSPILVKVQEAIKKIAKSKNYDYVTDQSMLLYFNESLDITDEVVTEVLRMDKEAGIEYPEPISPPAPVNPN